MAVAERGADEPRDTAPVLDPGSPWTVDEVIAVAEHAARKWAEDFVAARLEEIREGKKGFGRRSGDRLARALFGPHYEFEHRFVASLESSLGTLYGQLSAAYFPRRYTVATRIDNAQVYPSQHETINALVREYMKPRRRGGGRAPSVADYAANGFAPKPGETPEPTQVVVDKLLFHRLTGEWEIVEEKSGGDLDKGKARDTKTDMLRAYAALRNQLGPEAVIRLRFATFYNKDSDDEWKQSNVRRVCSPDELLIGPAYWEHLVGLPDAMTAVELAFETVRGQASAMRDRLYPVWCEAHGIVA